MTGAATSKLPAAAAVHVRGSDRIGERRDPWHNVSQAARDQAVVFVGGGVMIGAFEAVDAAGAADARCCFSFAS